MITELRTVESRQAHHETEKGTIPGQKEQGVLVLDSVWRGRAS